MCIWFYASLYKTVWDYVRTFSGNFVLGHAWCHDFLITAGYIYIFVCHMDYSNEGKKGNLAGLFVNLLKSVYNLTNKYCL